MSACGTYGCDDVWVVLMKNPFVQSQATNYFFFVAVGIVGGVLLSGARTSNKVLLSSNVKLWRSSKNNQTNDNEQNNE